MVATPIDTDFVTPRPRIILILGDQLSGDIRSLQLADRSTDIILMAEVAQEATYVLHHKKKIVFVFSAMRHFAQDLQGHGWRVEYTRYDNPENSGSLVGEVQRAVTRHSARGIVVTEPGEFRLRSEIETWSGKLGVDVDCVGDTRFLASHADIQNWARGRKQLRMEYFYREMRRKYSVLLDQNRPIGGQWNYDTENRKPPANGLDVPDIFRSQPDAVTQEVISLVETHFSDHFGDLLPFHLAVTRDQALTALEDFIAKRLSLFGDYQDAMIQNEPWMYHSHIGFYLNCGLLNPLECINRAEEAYHNETAPLNAVEGFIRQILGWREYVRGIYWLRMPEYKSTNYFEAKRPLPNFY